MCGESRTHGEGLPKSLLRIGGNVVFKVFEQPGDDNYLADTTLIDISGLTYGANYGSITDGILTVDFDTNMKKYGVSTDWVAWGDPPWVESSTPDVLFSNDMNTQTLTLSEPSTIFGFEFLPNLIGDWDYEVRFTASSGSVVLGTITMTLTPDLVDGGARLFAAEVRGASFDRIDINIVAGDSWGFAIAQVRYALQ